MQPWGLPLCTHSHTRSLLNNNDISGTLPRDFMYLKKLQRLWVVALVARLSLPPPSMVTRSSVCVRACVCGLGRRRDLANTRLVGTVPPEVVALPQLRLLCVRCVGGWGRRGPHARARARGVTRGGGAGVSQIKLTGAALGGSSSFWRGDTRCGRLRLESLSGWLHACHNTAAAAF